MLTSFFMALVEQSRKHALALVLSVLVLSCGLGVYVVRHIAINTDINQLLSQDLDWRQREKALDDAFPQKVDTLVVVIDGQTSFEAERAAAALATALRENTRLFSEVSRPDALPFFRTEGLLFLPEETLAETLESIARAQPLWGMMASDPTLRGFSAMLGSMAQGVQAGALEPDVLAPSLKEITRVLDATLDGSYRALDVQAMMPSSDDSPFAAREKRRYIIAKPLLDYSALQPGAEASAFVRETARSLALTPQNGVRVRLTGAVPLSDDEFASVAEGAAAATLLCGVLVLGLLLLALRSLRIVVPIALTLFVGLIVSTAFAIVTVGSLNLISVAFAVMFIGIAVDFGIQFGVRYRDERSREPDHAKALRQTVNVIAAPLAMAAGSTALGFFSFIPTDYRGLSELGLIAGAGMIIALILNVTFLPALMTLFKPPAENEAIGFSFLAPLNTFLTQKGRVLLLPVALLAGAAFVAAFHVRFDFDPLNLKNPETESVATMLEALKDPDSDAYAAQILASSFENARALAEKLSGLNEVDHTMTIESFIPDNQDEKLAMIADTRTLLAPTFALPRKKAPDDAEVRQSLLKAADAMRVLHENLPEATALARALTALAESPLIETRKKAEEALVQPLQAKYDDIRNLLDAKPVALSDIPAELKRDWVTEDGRYLVEVFPKRGASNDPRETAMLNRFIDAVQAVAPEASGSSVSIRESGRTITRAFIQAGIYGVASIALLSFLVLRRARDVVLMLLPLVLAGILTLATLALSGTPLNFANIIALPLLFSVGVSYAVYVVFFNRQGRRDFLQSSMARAVFFSAATVLVAFSSLCFSSHPGTFGMGKILTIALLYCLLCTFLVLPLLCCFHKKDTLP
ncbi:MAG: MMPL family transporter [Alphaproteobacteria bacterium]|nr:MMPL family transporter [Alphaproteobacteria bacterium]